MKKGIAFLSLMILHATATAQDDKIVTDRPTESQTAELVPKGFLQSETGIRKEAMTGADYNLLHPMALIKYGVSKKVELRAELTGASEKEYSKNEFRYGLKPVQFGFKTALLKGKGAIPQTTLYTMVGIPRLASKDHQVSHVLPQVRLLMQNKFNEQIDLEYNIGAEWEGEQTTPCWLIALNPQF